LRQRLSDYVEIRLPHVAAYELKNAGSFGVSQLKKADKVASVYSAQHTTFPDQSTADQLFDEAQFESYRELGYRCVEEVFNSIQKDEQKTHAPRALAAAVERGCADSIQKEKQKAHALRELSVADIFHRIRRSVEPTPEWDHPLRKAA
jgi:hypothetical protein